MTRLRTIVEFLCWWWPRFSHRRPLLAGLLFAIPSGIVWGICVGVVLFLWGHAIALLY